MHTQQMKHIMQIVRFVKIVKLRQTFGLTELFMLPCRLWFLSKSF